jgi:hypothetical protein
MPAVKILGAENSVWKWAPRKSAPEIQRKTTRRIGNTLEIPSTKNSRPRNAKEFKEYSLGAPVELAATLQSLCKSQRDFPLGASLGGASGLQPVKKPAL